mmetsp:Transcript_2509/g.7415  ORF Transcript_2509/g.7415 Transcript_2509/m.7415 type:complete len:215 (+) Transcript_2509:584-1228(+)
MTHFRKKATRALRSWNHAPSALLVGKLSRFQTGGILSSSTHSMTTVRGSSRSRSPWKTRSSVSRSLRICASSFAKRFTSSWCTIATGSLTASGSSGLGFALSARGRNGMPDFRSATLAAAATNSSSVSSGSTTVWERSPMWIVSASCSASLPMGSSDAISTSMSSASSSLVSRTCNTVSTDSCMPNSSHSSCAGQCSTDTEIALCDASMGSGSE